MKKRLIRIAIAALVLAAIVCIGAPFDTGTGGDVTATTTPGRLTGFAVNSISVFNSNTSNYVHVLVNCTTNVLAARITAGTAITIPPNMSYPFNAETKAQITSVCYATTNLTAALNIAGF